MLAYTLHDITKSRAKGAGPLDLIVSLQRETEPTVLVSFIFNGPYFATWPVATAARPDDPFFSQDCKSGGSGRTPALYPQSWRGKPLHTCLLACLETIRLADLTAYPWLRMLFLADITYWPEQPPDLDREPAFGRGAPLRQIDFAAYRVVLQRQFYGVA